MCIRDRNEAGLYADRLSVNVEIPKEENLKLLAPEKDHKSVYAVSYTHLDGHGKMETEVIPPFADEVELLLVAESLFEMEAGSRVLAVLNLPVSYTHLTFAGRTMKSKSMEIEQHPFFALSTK